MNDNYNFITREVIDGSIVRICMNRPESRNAQSFAMLSELNDALLLAEKDPEIRVIVLGGLGPSFSSGHDLRDWEDYRGAGQSDSAGRRTGKSGAEDRFLREWEYYLTYTKQWRDLRKITIAQVQGYCLAAGLMLAWCCDLIVAAENAVFADVVGTRLGMCGLEYFAHPWELGARKAKELLLTGDALGAEEAHRLGMVNKVFPAERLEAETVNFAKRIAMLPSVTSLLIKESVNQTQDIQGFSNALKACFSIHELNHSHWAEVTGGVPLGTPEFGVRRDARISPLNHNESGYSP